MKVNYWTHVGQVLSGLDAPEPWTAKLVQECRVFAHLCNLFAKNLDSLTAEQREQIEGQTLETWHIIRGIPTLKRESEKIDIDDYMDYVFGIDFFDESESDTDSTRDCY